MTAILTAVQAYIAAQRGVLQRGSAALGIEPLHVQTELDQMSASLRGVVQDLAPGAGPEVYIACVAVLGTFMNEAHKHVEDEDVPPVTGALAAIFAVALADAAAAPPEDALRRLIDSVADAPA